ncbi:hypothetical protein Ferp_0672 [Ferroglobus placidus DSM 10642]|uniref:Uncharacterized protein n=1 Tax=Ferroglobus placidus (strain DSM 10642 / AEDII12DO) TaxID=589924 RepID=D3S3L0_FERPA|nr:cytochrome c3 family protein [Ferroglobus placidus]ADC64843.1 hypothetical protein Ferp_0672 [Ferroglobus placidus DSM 10642]
MKTRFLTEVALSILLLLVIIPITEAQEFNVKLSLDRLVVLDDPNSGSAASGFQNPPKSWDSDWWYGRATTIKAYAVVLGEEGALSGVQVTFRLINPNGNVEYTTTATTNAAGIAEFEYDMNNKNYYGYWKVEAEVTLDGVTKRAEQTFVYNWWGCAWCHGNEKLTDHGTYTPKSPFVMGYDFHRNPKKGEHVDPIVDGRCTVCHQSYDAIPHDSYAMQGKDAIKNAPPADQYPAGIHKDKVQCEDCHEQSTVRYARPEVPGCYDTCHPLKNFNLTAILTTTGYSVGGSYRSFYAYDVNTGEPAKAHTSQKTVPCLSCHNAAHNNTKPYVGADNSYTENEQCLSCHLNGQHSTTNPVDCVDCHSQDAHSIKVVKKGGGYDSPSSSNSVLKKDCEECHVSTTGSFFESKGYSPRTDSFGNSIAKHAGKVDCKDCHGDESRFHRIAYLSSDGSFADKQSASYCFDCHTNSGANSYIESRGYYPLAITSFQHGNASYDGKNWGTYWSSDREACYYCHQRSPHGDVKGNVSGLDVKADLSGKACAACHVKSYSGYIGDRLNPEPPAIDVNNTGRAKNSAGEEWYNHTRYLEDYNDATCFGCHAPSPDFPRDFYAFVHNVEEGLRPGADCASCHDLNERPPKRVDVSAFSNSVHANLNSNALNSTPVNPLSKACWLCHGDGTEPSDHPDNYKNPKKCEDCHLSGNYGAPVVEEHIKSGKHVKVSAECWDCHGISEMVVLNSDEEGSSKAFASHYAKLRQDLWVRGYSGDVGLDCYYCHQNATSAFKAVMKNENHTYMPDHGLNDRSCWACHGLEMHVRLDKPSVSNTYCKSCHSGYELHNGTVSCYVCHMDGSDTTYDSPKAQIHGIKYPSANGYTSVKSKGCYGCHTGKLSKSTNAWGVSVPTIPEFSHSNYPNNGTRWGDYWNSVDDACIYCHTPAVHSSNLKGNVSIVKGSNSYRADLANSYWCSACHYSSYSGYKGDSLNPTPPDIASYSTPSDGIKWFDHSSYISSDYSDAKCLECHGENVVRSNEFVHAVKEGVGGACMDCHTDPYYSSVAVNVSSFGRHAKVDGREGLDVDDCRICHYSPWEMLRSGWTIVSVTCEDCHKGNVPEDVKITAFQHGSNSCIDCHAGGGYEKGKLYHYDFSTPYGSVKDPGWSEWSKSVVDCYDCHVSHAKSEPFYAIGISSYMATSFSSCGGVNCHGGGTVHNVVKSPYMYPPFVRVSIERNMVLEGETVSVSADIWGYDVQINDSWYEVLDAKGNVLLSGKALPSDGSFGGLKNGYGYERVEFSFNANFEPGVYEVRVYAEKDTGMTSYGEAELIVGAAGSSAANFYFESWNLDGTLTNWAFGGSGTLEKSSISKSGYSAKITATSEAWIESIKFPVESNKEYLVIVFANFSNKVGLTVKKWSNNALLETTPEVVAEGNPGRWIAFGTVVNSGNADNLSILLKVYSGYAYFDNVSVVAVPLLENRAVNGEFEEDEDAYASYEKSDENVKAWEPKKVSGFVLPAKYPGRGRVLAVLGTGYWTSAYQDESFSTAARSYARDYGIRMSGEFIILADIYKSSEGFGGVELTFWDWSFDQAKNNLVEDGSYKVGFYDSTDWRTVVIIDDMNNANLLQIKLKGENVKELMFDRVRCYLNEGVVN